MDTRFFRTILILCILSSAGLPGLGSADCVDYGSYMHITAFEQLAGGPGVAFTVSRSYAYVACAGFGLEVVDISDPTYPRLLSSVATQNARDVAVSGSYAYIEDYFNIKVADISDPARPRIVAHANAYEGSNSVAIFGSYLYVASGSHGIRVIDISNPLQPVVLTDLNIPASYIEISGSYAYVIAGGLQILDISNPLSPVIVGTLNTTVNLLSISGSYAYITGGGLLQVVDVSDPTSPFVVGEVDAGGSSIFAAGSVVYAISSVLMAIDVSNPAQPTLAGVAQLSSSGGTDVFVSGSYAYVTEYNPGHFDVIDVTNAASPSPVRGTVPASGDVAVSGTHAYTTGPTFQVIDISDPMVPTITGTLTLPNSGGSVAVQGAYAYVRSFAGVFYVVDVSNPSTPTLTGTVSSLVGGSGLNLTVSGSYAYLGNGGIIVIDISNPAAPTIVKKVQYTGMGSSIAVYGSYAYVGGDGGTAIFSISVPTNPTLLPGGVGPGFPIVAGSYLYITPPSLSGILQIFSLSSPTAPALLGSVGNLGTVWDTAISGSIAYVATGALAVHAIDVSNPTSPHDLGSLALADGARTLAASTSKLYVIGSTRLSILPLQCFGTTGVEEAVPIVHRLYQNSPNPFQGTTHVTFDLPEASWVTLKVFDLSGREVRMLADSWYPAGKHELTWDAHDAAGHSLAEGIYFLHMSAGSFADTRRVYVKRSS